MRKLKTLLLSAALLLTAGNVWAQQVTTADGFSNEKVYTIKTPNSGRGDWTITADKTKLTTTVQRTDAPDADKLFAVLTFEGFEGRVIYSPSAKKFLYHIGGKDANNVGLTEGKTHAWEFREGTWNGYTGLLVKKAGEDFFVNSNGSSTIVMNDWGNPDAGDCMQINPVDDFSAADYAEAKEIFFKEQTTLKYEIYFNGTKVAESADVDAVVGTAPALPDAMKRDYCAYTYTSSAIQSGQTTERVDATWSGPFVISADVASAHWYNMTVRNADTFVGYDATSNPNVKTAASSAKPDQLWAFLGDPYNGVTLVNGSNTSLTLGYQDSPEGMNLSADNEIKWLPQVSGNRTNGFYLKNSNTGKRPNHRTGTGFLLNWDGADAGSTFVVEEPRVEVTYILKYNDAVIGSVTTGAALGQAAALPAAEQRDYCEYAYNPQTITVGTTEVEVTVTWTGPALSADLATANWQNLAIRGNWYVTSDNVDGDGALKTVNANALGLVEDAYQWALVGDPYHIQVFNKAKTDNFGYSDEEKVNGGVPAFQSATSYWTVKPSTGSIANSFLLTVPGTNLQINQFGGAGGSLKFYNFGGTNDDGSAFTIFDVPTDFSTYVADLAPYFEATGYFSVKDEVKNAAGWNADLKTACSFEQYKALRDAVDALTSDSYIYPETGYYRIRSKYYEGEYMGLKAATLYGNYKADADIQGAPTVIKLNRNGNQYSLQVQGKYVQAPSQSTSVALIDANEVFFTPAIPKAGVVGFSATDNDATYSCLHRRAAGDIVGWVLNADASHFILEDAASISVAVSAAGYATLNVPFAVTIPSDVKAYTGKINGNYLLLNEVSGTIPANTAVVLAADQGSYTFNITADVAAIDNDLQGTLTEAKPDGALTLQVIDEAIGFYTFDGTAIGANKAYISLPGNGNDVKALTLQFSEVDAINSPSRDSADQGSIYNIAGQRVQNAQRGIYIRNHKKVLVK